MPDTPTVAITKSGVTLLQFIGDPAARRPCLILYSGVDAGMPLHLELGTYVIGRAPESHLQLDSPGISRRHAELHVSEDKVTLVDLGSVNGSYVNDVRIETPTVLAGGDLIRLGALLLRYYESQSLEAALHDRIYRTATVDSCTEVFNRRYLIDTLKREIRLARQKQTPLSVVCYDLDHFKTVNDRYGHAAGDIVLRDTAGLVRTALQGVGVVGRLGGEEFAVVLPRIDTGAAVEHAVRACRLVAEHAFVIGAAEHRQTMSAGVAALEAAMSEPTDLLAAADRKLYASKDAGRNRVTS